jgi:hypothetical protein
MLSLEASQYAQMQSVHIVNVSEQASMLLTQLLLLPSMQAMLCCCNNAAEQLQLHA